jgi:hypothetical protein
LPVFAGTSLLDLRTRILDSESIVDYYRRCLSCWNWPESVPGTSLLLAVHVGPPYDGCDLSTDTMLTRAELSSGPTLVLVETMRDGTPFGEDGRTDIGCPASYTHPPQLSLVSVPLERLPAGKLAVVVTHRGKQSGRPILPGSDARTVIELPSR